MSEQFDAFDDTHHIFFHRDRNRTSLTYQARIGAEFDVGGRNVSAAYRYVHVKDYSFTGATGIEINTAALKHHVLELGTTF